MKASNGCKAKGMSGPCDNGENGMGLNENKCISTKIDKNISIMYMYILLEYQGPPYCKTKASNGCKAKKTENG